MLEFSVSGIVKTLSNPQNIYDGVILGLNYMPTKPVAIASAAILSGVALYLARPETLLTQISVISISSGLGWAATEAAHQIGSKLWKKRLAKLEADYNEYEKTPEAIDSKRRIEEISKKLLDDLFASPDFLEQLNSGNSLNQTINATE